jgi:hypothetical protein
VVSVTRAEYLRGYIKAWRAARRAQLIEMLGGRCVRCGAVEDLEFDHIDPITKRFAVGASLSRAWSELVKEALKCQLLCCPCHIDKGAEDRPEPVHGYYRYWYYGCRCADCRAANAAKSARLRTTNSEFSVTVPANHEDPERVSAAQDGNLLPRRDSNLEPAG